ncbi:hypothetical protein TL16_g08398 [Triparma laevis f. inornata]|uniref:RING-type domain-containing protein n=1 Tax=Triparma laevis f. inornata TaxID=1714386 RepID=A0A9W7EIN4_9STRA|nr:hypothetical protein TL16_g08398 [Triparma laevis f. inornata]
MRERYGSDLLQSSPRPPPIPHPSNSSYTSTSSSSSPPNENKCVLCYVETANANLSPCNHTVTCSSCVCQLLDSNKPCLICRRVITNFSVGNFPNSVYPQNLFPTTVSHLTHLPK